MSSRVLVTGGAGFVGAYLTRDLVARGDQVVVFDEHPNTNVLSRILPEPPHEAVKLHAGTTQNPLAMLRVCQSEQIERVIHLASPLTEAIAADPPAGIAAACVGTANVFEVARILRLQRVVWTSSITVFGAHDSGRDGALADDAPHCPVSMYGHCKSLCEALSADYRDQRGLDVVGLRFSVLYGAWRARGLKPSFGTAEDQLWQAANGLPIVIQTPRHVLNWQYIEDVSDALIRTLYAPKPAKAVYNTSGEIATFRRYGELLKALAPETSIRMSEGAENAPTVPFEFDDSAFSEEIGYGQHHTLEAGLTAALKMYSATRVAED